MWSSYAIESGVVIYRSDANKTGTRVAGADPDSFRLLERDPCLSGGYARDRNAVYYEGVKIPGGDPQSFEPIRDTYARDNAWWYGAGVPLASRRGGELRVLSSGYAIHPEGAFYGARRLEADGFEVLGGSGYARSRNRAYFAGEEIPGIDAASLSVFARGDWIARDKRTVVIKGRVEPRFDAPSFEVLSPYEGFVKDRNHVYYEFQPVEGADPARSASIGRGYWRDGESLYYRANRVSGADLESFRLMPAIYGLDKHRVYVNGTPLPGRDPASFQFVGMAASGYSRDRNGIYYRDHPVPGADPETFSFIASGYWKDKGGIYFEGRPVRGADIESFSVRAFSTARDKSYGFDRGRPVCARTREASAGLPMCDPAQY